MVQEALWQVPAGGTWREKVTASGGGKHSEGPGRCEHECRVQVALYMYVFTPDLSVTDLSSWGLKGSLSPYVPH